DEMSEVSCESKFYYPNKEIIFYNLNGYYDGIKQWLAHAEKEGFIYDGALKRIHFASNLEEIAAILG
ncbi:MAG: LOG family protein, partial [Bacilli bacterium]|nr:LOG family protein [Bacilli bacterium]